MNYRLKKGALAEMLGDDMATPGAQAYVRHEIAMALFEVLAGRTAPLILGAPLGWWLYKDTLAVLLTRRGPAVNDASPTQIGEEEEGT